MDEELESIIKKAVEEINKNLYGKLFLDKEDKEELILQIYDYGEGYVEFIMPFNNSARSMKELMPLFDYIKKKGYKTNLD